MDKTIIAHSAEETEEVGVELSSHLKDGMVIALMGSLGAGKTTFVKGLAKGLLVRDIVVSPSYLLAREDHGRLVLHHLDAYRISSLAELVEVGLDRLIPPEDGVTAIEWPERVEGIVEISDFLIKFELLAENARRIHITQP
jgi:tRNA threonylcarbamoyladenosine biosynthesis protein TsaE